MSAERLTAFPSHQKHQLATCVDPKRRIMHVDMDAFFASLEQNKNPHLRHKPVIVGTGPDQRGVVSTASYEARVFGVRSGMSSAQAARLCPEAIFIGVDARHYIYVSTELLKIYGDFSPTVEAVSVDEAFLDVTGCGALFGGEEQLAQRLKDRIRQQLSLTCSVGIAPNKIMAKMASSVFKPDGLTVIRPDDVERILYPLPVDAMWGIGPVAQRQLHALSIHTIGDLAQADLLMLRRTIGSNGVLMGRLARGEDESPVLGPDDQADEKSVGHERTLDRDTNDREYLLATLNYLSDLVGRRLRKLGWCGCTVTIRYRYSDFTTYTRQATCPVPTGDTQAIYRIASRLFLANWGGRRRIRLLGVSVSDLYPHEQIERQFELFHEREIQESRRPSVDQVVDRLRNRFGECVITRAHAHMGAND